jgi:hypothetical protein
VPLVNLKNYTSSIPVHRTISYIEAYLAECGVVGITKEYADKTPVAIFFHIDLGTAGRFTIRLPARVVEVQEYLWRDYVTGKSRPQKTKEDFADQAARTAWKIQQDWVQVQMSLIKLRQVEFLEVFMGFLWDGKQSYYNKLKTRSFRALLPEKASDTTE